MFDERSNSSPRSDSGVSSIVMHTRNLSMANVPGPVRRPYIIFHRVWLQVFGKVINVI